jgi:hypothetical protein
MTVGQGEAEARSGRVEGRAGTYLLELSGSWDWNGSWALWSEKQTESRSEMERMGSGGEKM